MKASYLGRHLAPSIFAELESPIDAMRAMRATGQPSRRRPPIVSLAPRRVVVASDPRQRDPAGNVVVVTQYNIRTD